jgi:hypothetical protein
MLGSVKFDGGINANLDENLVWSSESRDLATYLNARFKGYSPADGEPGRKLLQDVASQLGGTVTAIPLVAATKPGMVY